MESVEGAGDIREFDRVVLTDDIDHGRFRAGDVGTVVYIHQGGAGYEVEFFALNGDTIDVATVESSQIRKVSEADVTHARRLVG